MTLRPRQARWFEVLTDREHLGAVLGRLAATHAVELEAKSAVAGVAALPDYRIVLGEFGELTRRYAPFHGDQSPSDHYSGSSPGCEG